MMALSLSSSGLPGAPLLILCTSWFPFSSWPSVPCCQSSDCTTYPCWVNLRSDMIFSSPSSSSSLYSSFMPLSFTYTSPPTHKHRSKCNNTSNIWFDKENISYSTHSLWSFCTFSNLLYTTECYWLEYEKEYQVNEWFDVIFWDWISAVLVVWKWLPQVDMQQTLIYCSVMYKTWCCCIALTLVRPFN